MKFFTLIGFLLIVLIPLASAEEVELKYDDGTNEGGMGLGGWMHVVSFSPPAKPWEVKKIRIYGMRYGTTPQEFMFSVTILDKDFNVISQVRESHSNFIYNIYSWVDINIFATVKDDFYVVVNTDSKQEYGIRLGYDKSVNNTHSEVAKEGKLVNWSINIPKDTTNWMIRVVGSIQSTPLPTSQAPTAPAPTVTAGTEPINDMFDPNGNPTEAVPYMDIANASLSVSGDTYTITLTMNGDIPNSIDDFIEWDMLIDVDQNSETRTWGPWSLIDNGIGVDYIARFCMYQSQTWADVSTWKSPNRVQTKVTDGSFSGRTVTFTFKSADIGNPTNFNYVFAVRLYTLQNNFIKGDKAPNSNYYVFSASNVPLTSTPTKSAPGFDLIIAAIGVMMVIYLCRRRF